MTASPYIPKSISVEGFEFDAERRELVGPAGAVALSRKEFDLLSLLVSRRPRAVSKDEIHEALWPRTIVAETSLTTLVKELRTKLGQTGRQGPIRTVHGFGYALAENAAGAGNPAVLRRCLPRLVRGTAEISMTSQELILGREAGSAGTIDDASVSRRHARLAREGDAVVLTDLGSKNGTYVGGVRILAPVALRDGDEVRLGLVFFVFREPDAQGLPETKTVV
ncbi:MAG: FHA domain-containing protein [Acidobacteriota bacterium]